MRGSLLDPVSPSYLEPMYRLVFERLEAGGMLDLFRSHARSLLFALDGTEYFSSQKINCANCSHRQLANGKTNYYHSALTPVIVQANNEHVISLEPEFILPQDGHEKQDCEIEAGKRWLLTHGKYYAKYNVTILGDDLYSRQPFCQAVKDAKMHFILVCKEDSHPQLYETVAFLAAQKLSAEIKRAELNRLRYVDYKYFLDFRSIAIDPFTQIATISVVEDNDVVYEISTDSNPEEPIVLTCTTVSI